MGLDQLVGECSSAYMYSLSNVLQRVCFPLQLVCKLAWISLDTIRVLDLGYEVSFHPKPTEDTLHNLASAPTTELFYPLPFALKGQR